VIVSDLIPVQELRCQWWLQSSWDLQRIQFVVSGPILASFIKSEWFVLGTQTSIHYRCVWPRVTDEYHSASENQEIRWSGALHEQLTRYIFCLAYYSRLITMPGTKALIIFKKSHNHLELKNKKLIRSALVAFILCTYAVNCPYSRYKTIQFTRSCLAEKDETQYKELYM